ncbi:MAG TPA: phosphate/phosphite/phosphonate ABC transporter substrate-binding protein [Polyangiaceae bacterium]|jgi:ABC-type phosphate/phosphonate transport system substrate-binding protein
MITVGAVAYDPKVVTIWEGMRSYFRDEAKLPVEVVLYLSYEAQVDALLGGRIDVAWNTNLAFVQCERWSEGKTAPLAMRDTDLVWESKIIALAGGPVGSLEDLKGRRLAIGSRDSGHAAILPVHFLSQHGLREGTDYQPVRFDTDLGKHGDTGTSEVDVLKAVMEGRADAGAVGSPFWQGVTEKKLVPAGALSVVWTSPAFHHCMFTARVGLAAEDAARFEKALFAMSWDNPRHRAVLEAEGLREWVAPRMAGYESLRAAAEKQGLLRRP